MEPTDSQQPGRKVERPRLCVLVRREDEPKGLPGVEGEGVGRDYASYVAKDVK